MSRRHAHSLTTHAASEGVMPPRARWLFRRVWSWYADAKRKHAQLSKAHHAALDRVVPGLIRNVRLLDRRARGEVPRSYEKLAVAKPSAGKRVGKPRQ